MSFTLKFASVGITRQYLEDERPNSSLALVILEDEVTNLIVTSASQSCICHFGLVI